MPKASSAQPEVDSKPYIRPASPSTPPPKPKKEKNTSTAGSPSKGAGQGWSMEDKHTLLMAVLATAKPDFKAIAAEKFAHQGRNANQVSNVQRCPQCRSY